MKYLITFLLSICLSSAFCQIQQIGTVIDPDQNKNKQYIGISSNGKELLSNKKKPLGKYEIKGHFKSILLTDFADAIGDYLLLKGGSVPDGDKGDITVSGGGASWVVDVGLVATKIADGSISNTEFQFLNNVSSNIQTQLDSKDPSSTNEIQGIDDVLGENETLTASRQISTNANSLTIEHSTNNSLVINNSGVTIGDVTPPSSTGTILLISDVAGHGYIDNTAHNVEFGINKNNPSIALDVVGAGNLTGNITANNLSGTNTGDKHSFSHNLTQTGVRNHDGGGFDWQHINLSNYFIESSGNVISMNAGGVEIQANNGNLTFIGLAQDNSLTDVLAITGGSDFIKKKTIPILESGTYFPATGAQTNLDVAPEALPSGYSRIDNSVTFSGIVNLIDPTLTATITTFEINLPIGTNVTAIEDVAGTAVCGNISGMSAAITGSIANDTAVFTFRSTDVTSQSMSFHITYKITP